MYKRQPDAPTVENQESNPDSLLHTVKALLALRHDQADLQADAEFEPLYAKKGAMPFVYRRGALTVSYTHLDVYKRQVLSLLDSPLCE